jgi:hypothetical protein
MLAVLTTASRRPHKLNQKQKTVFLTDETRAEEFRRFAVSPFRRFAVSPFRRFAVSPFRRFAVSPIRRP